MHIEQASHEELTAQLSNLEQAYAELVEYVRVSVQLIYDDTAPVRAAATKGSELH